MNKRLKIGITHGDINGISYEIILKALSNPQLLELCTPIIYGSPKVLGAYRKMFDLGNVNVSTISSPDEAHGGKAYIINCCGEDIKLETGKQSTDAGALALNALNAATEDLTGNKIDALVTAPINKSTIQSDKFNFPGHTEYLEKVANQRSIMMLTSDNVRVALTTNHTPISKVSSTISKELILSKLKMLHESLIKDFCITCPRIAVLGLNPHSSDNGLLGDEEDRIIKPAINEANSQGIVCTGPLSADGFWGRAHLPNTTPYSLCTTTKVWLRLRLFFKIAESISRQAWISYARRPLTARHTTWQVKTPPAATHCYEPYIWQ